ncbi:MAG TPA: hypothetical protein DFR83_22925 [Deltaproteobacteria bacterium]|nr:hypothetical protein [Deltaproteobacteria bacterium]
MNASAQPAGTALSCTAILDAMPIGVAVVNQEGTIESANLTFARLTDVDRGALVHAPAQEILGLASAAMSAALAECDTFGEASLPVNASPAGRPLMVHLSAVFSDGADRRILTATPLPAHDHIPIGSSNTAAGPAMPLAPSAPVPPAPSHNRLLLVEDDSVVAMVARAHLEELGLTVDVARTGRRAMELTEAQAYRWVILDCILPDVDGFAVFQHLRHLPNTH